MPSDKTLTSSVYRIEGLDDAAIWSIGKEYVEKGRKIKARADLAVTDVLNVALSVEALPQPHRRHANIVGWEADKGKQRLIALELARASRLRLPS